MTTSYAWTPTPQYVERANVKGFMDRHGIASLAELLRRAEDVAWFWGAVERDLGFQWFAPYQQVLDESAGIAWAKWYVGGRTNIALNCVDRHAPGLRRDKLAVIWEGEDGAVRQLTYAELLALTNQLAASLVEQGVQKGDAVGVFMPMIPETVVALLAIAKIGGLFVPLFSGFGVDAVEKRLNDAAAKVLLTCDGFFRKGQTIAMKKVADEAAAKVPTLRRMIVYPRLVPSSTPAPRPSPAPGGPGLELDWRAALANQPTEYPTMPMDSEDPWMIIYTSGTTGRPQGAVHVHGGFMVKVAQEVAHQTDLHDDDTLFWFTDMGWIMGPWEVVGALALGGTIFIYEGVPDYPKPDRLWDMVERHRITTLGVSPTLVRALQKYGDEWPRKHDLSSLRILGSTGEPWNPEPWWWFFQNVGGGRCPLINFSGGTEVGACFLSPTPLTPLLPTSLGHPSLGLAVDIVDDAGRPVPPGTVGELVAKRPWPAMTRGLWKDPERYLQTYWSRWPNLWYHGDFASRDSDGNWYLHGRSDDTIKIAGKRLGPAEIESILVDTGLVSEAAAIGLPDPLKGEVVHAYAILRPGQPATAETQGRLMEAVEHALGKSFRPQAIHLVKDLPRTRNAKILRRAVRAKAAGLDPGDLSNLANPEALNDVERLL